MLDWKKTVTAGTAAALLFTQLAASAVMASAAPESSEMILYAGKHEAYANGRPIQLELPPARKEERTYIPLAVSDELFGLSVIWNEPTQSVRLLTPKGLLEWVPAAKAVRINGEEQPFGETAYMEDGRLYVDLDWLGEYVGFKARYNDELQRLELLYIKPGLNGTLGNDKLPNAKPVAKFAFDKDVYRLGEPIRYTDLSYDPDGDELISREWVGNAKAIFTPGLYKVSLKVTDAKGNVSDEFSRNVLVSSEEYLDPFEHGVYYEPVGKYVHEEEAVLRKYLRDIPQFNIDVKTSNERPLIVSDSPETFTEKGFLYQEKVNGKARLYADHVNGMNEEVQFAIVVRNPDPEQTVTIKTTNRGEVYPSIYANLIGHEATLEFLQGEQPPETMVLGPHETAFYRLMTKFYPGQGVNVIYDVETDGEVYFSFVAMDPGAGPESVGTYKQLPFSGNVRGTFEGSEVQWTIQADKFDTPTSVTIGDGVTDKFVTGSDFFTREPSTNLGNYGVVYKIRIERPRKMALLLLARGGPFRGPFKINGTMVAAPPSGIMMDYQGYTILTRTTGNEKTLDIEFSPAAGSAFPVDLIFYPIDEE